MWFSESRCDRQEGNAVGLDNAMLCVANQVARFFGVFAKEFFPSLNVSFK